MSAIRFGGLVSGFDTDQMVKDLMKVERTKVDKLEQDKQTYLWKQEAYNDLNKDMANFILDTRKSFGLTSTSYTGTLSNNSVSELSWVKGATSSDETTATVSATAAAVAGSYDVHVTSLATNVSMASANDLGAFDTLENQFGLNTGTDVIEFTITSKDGVSNTFTYSGADLGTLTVKDVVNDINNFRDVDGKDLGVKAVYDENISRFFFQTTETGASNGFTITKGGTATVDFITGGASKLQLGINSGQEYSGTDGSIDFAGAMGISIDSNQVTINGISMDLKKENSDFTVLVETDVDSVYDKISSFVESYNALVEKMGSKISEKSYRDYKPLTEEQRSELSENEIELWEEKAKSGLLRQDRIFSTTLTHMRSGLYEDVVGASGSYSHLNSIGIATQKYSSGTVGGKLEIDEDTLKEAIRNDADGVLELLFKQPDSSLVDEDQIRAESGLVTRLYSDVVDGMKEVINKAGTGANELIYKDVQSNMLLDFIADYSGVSMLDESVYGLDNKIDDMNDYLIRIEDNYWKKFAAMEKALSQMQAQSGWLSQQMGGM